MGMFDSLIVPCSACGKDVEFQSKSGPCVCACFTLDNCPPDIAGDVIGQSKQCECGKVTKIHGRVLIMAD